MSKLPTQSQLEAEYKLFTDSIENYFSSSAQKTAVESLAVPAAALVGNPFIKNHSMSSPCGVWYRFCGRGRVLVGMVDICSGNRVRAS